MILLMNYALDYDDIDIVVLLRIAVATTHAKVLWFNVLITLTCMSRDNRILFRKETSRPAAAAAT